MVFLRSVYKIPKAKTFHIMWLGITTGSFWPESTAQAITEILELGFRKIEITLQRPELGFGFFHPYE